VVEHLPDGDGVLAVPGELRPELGDRGVVTERPGVALLVRQGRHRAVADGEVVEDGVRPLRAPGRRVGQPGHRAHDLLAVDERATWTPSSAPVPTSSSRISWTACCTSPILAALILRSVLFGV
jgi:hypothetical protein